MLHPHLLTLVASMVACSSSMIGAVRLARSYSKSSDPIVIVGPTGTGKSRLARQIHLWSGRGGRLAEVSARELCGSLAYDQLFGHERGAFTDAVGRRHGVFAEAGAGTVLLDDAHLLDRSAQMLLLRALDTGVYRPLGTDREVPIGSRLIVGTQRGLDELVALDLLLPDLRYRLGFFEIRLDPLGERRGDIGPLTSEFLKGGLGEIDSETALTASPDVLAVLESASWPGNVRELEYVVRYASWMAQESGARQVEVEHLPAHLRVGLQFDPLSDRATKERLVSWALWRTGGHVGRAAELIHAHRNTVATLRAEMHEQALDMHNRRPPLVQSDVGREAWG
jgi:DNA-binding NtrC family response regulator